MLRRSKLRPILFSALLAMALGLAPTHADAAKKKKRAPASRPAKKELRLNTGEAGPIDELEDQVYRIYKNKRAVKLAAAWKALEDKKFAEAKKLAQSLVADPRFGDYARWIAAESELHLGHAPAAVALLAPIPSKFPYSPLNKALHRELSGIESNMGREACAAKKWALCETDYENALERVHGTPDMAYVQPQDLGNYALACSKLRTEMCLSWTQRLTSYYSHSTEEYKALVAAFPELKERQPRPPGVTRLTQSYHAPDLDTTAMDQAMQLYLDGKFKDAIEAFRKFNDEFPRSSARFRANYWLAEALKKTGKDDEAKKVLTDLQKTSPLTYYGLLAALEIDKNPYEALDLDPPSATDFDPFLAPGEIYKLRRAQNLIAAKAYGLAAIELRDFRARDGLSSDFLVYLAMLHAEAKSWVTAFTILNDLIARGNTAVFSQYFAKLIFPTDPLPQIKKYASEVKIDPVLVMSLIKQESSFDATASSSSGALGLMQLMPTTAVDTVAGTARHELLSPETNLKTGTLYLSKLLSRYDGNMVYATASYNAGPGAVNRWIHSAPQNRTMLEFIESIPYRETREYVSAIIRNYYWYTRRLNPDGVGKLSLDFFWHNYGPQVSINTPAPTEAPHAETVSEEKPLPPPASPRPSPRAPLAEPSKDAPAEKPSPEPSASPSSSTEAPVAAPAPASAPDTAPELDTAPLVPAASANSAKPAPSAQPEAPNLPVSTD